MKKVVSSPNVNHTLPWFDHMIRRIIQMPAIPDQITYIFVQFSDLRLKPTV